MNYNDNCFIGKTILIDADSLCFTSINDDFETAKSKFEWKLERIRKLICWSGEKFIFFLTIGKSFRNELQIDYKSNRKNIRPKTVSQLKDYIKDKYNNNDYYPSQVIYEVGYEADDLICDMYRSDPDNYVLCSIDKDILYNMPGQHINLYNLNIDSNDLIVKVTEEESINNLNIQIIKGDKIDNIPDLIKGIGPVKLKLLKEECGLSYEDIGKYICYKKGIDYTTRYRMLYCGKSESIQLEGSKITHNEVIDSFIDGTYSKKRKVKINYKLKSKYSSSDTITFGKHKGSTWIELKYKEPSYINWFINKTEDDDLKMMLIKLLK